MKTKPTKKQLDEIVDSIPDPVAQFENTNENQSSSKEGELKPTDEQCEMIHKEAGKDIITIVCQFLNGVIDQSGLVDAIAARTEAAFKVGALSRTPSQDAQLSKALQELEEFKKEFHIMTHNFLAEKERVRKLVELVREAYREGIDDGLGERIRDWIYSNACHELKAIQSLSLPAPKPEEPKHFELPSVGGKRSLMSNAEFERACLVTLGNEIQKMDFSDGALIALLAEAVRIVREYSDTMNGLGVPKPEEDKVKKLVEAAQAAYEELHAYGDVGGSNVAAQLADNLREALQSLNLNSKEGE